MLNLALAFAAGLLIGLIYKKRTKIDSMLLLTIVAIVFYVGTEVGRSRAIFNVNLLILSVILSFSAIVFSVLFAHILTRGG